MVIVDQPGIGIAEPQCVAGIIIGVVSPLSRLAYRGIFYRWNFVRSILRG